MARIIGLNLLSTALETLGTRLLHLTPLLGFARGQLCQTILWASRSQNLFVLSFVMRLVLWLHTTMRVHLKMQLELLLREVLCHLQPLVLSSADPSCCPRRLPLSFSSILFLRSLCWSLSEARAAATML